MSVPITLILLSMFVLAGCGPTTDLDKLEQRDGLYYEIGKTKPYSGKIDSSYSKSSIYGKPYNGIVIARGSIISGKKEGTWKEWYARGLPFYEGEYINGLAQGQHTWWHPNGEKMLSGPYVDGMRHGSSTKWYETGRQNLVLQYEQDKLHGDQYQWDTAGNMTMHEIYQQGTIICSEVFDTQGQTKSKKGICQ